DPRNATSPPAAWVGPQKPIARPMKPPSKAPAIPSKTVTMRPPGSRPGVTNLAIIPTTRPKRIHDRIVIRPSCLLVLEYCKRKDLNCQVVKVSGLRASGLGDFAVRAGVPGALYATDQA